MPDFRFGQPHGGIVQFAYTVADIEKGMADYTRLMGVGPWFVMGPFTTPRATYRGAPTQIELTLAIGFAGHMMVELIQQHDDKPSVYREYVERKGHGFHHWAIGSRDFDADVARYEAQGYEIAFSDVSPRGVRVVYMDIGRDVPGMLEIIELTDGLEERYTMMFEASRTWDGTTPVRRGV
jgi:hypothetical protein